jgi:hypothetical protein
MVLVLGGVAAVRLRAALLRRKEQLTRRAG